VLPSTGWCWPIDLFVSHIATRLRRERRAKSPALTLTRPFQDLACWRREVSNANHQPPEGGLGEFSDGLLAVVAPEARSCERQVP
jgi:hypothetical protein